MQLSTDHLAEIVQCPDCATPIDLEAVSTHATCASCGSTYARLAHGWDLTPRPELTGGGIWDTWQHVQANGVVSYEADPENNLNVGPRSDSAAFAEFCAYDGLVLDVGCGPQPWPSHFSGHTDRTNFVGIDPLVGQMEAGYTRVRGLAEYLPFRADSFDMVVFATTIDHFVDPLRALREGARVAKPRALLMLWVGHKRDGAPPPERSHDWYERLAPAPGADDLFHIKRFGVEETGRLLASAGLEVAEHEEHRVDEWRSNHFYRVIAPGQ